MKKIIILLLVLVAGSTYAKKNVHDAHLIGDVVTEGKHLAFANIFLKGTTIGTITDESGHFQIINLDPGKYTVVAQMLGFKTVEKEIEIVAQKTVEVRFEMVEDALRMDEIVVTGDKQIKTRAKSMTIVNSLPADMLKNTSATAVADGLNFVSGLRMENNCQNCGFNQVRMNGLEGPYSQILINGNPIFSGLAGVYGLELIPANMIDKIEVVRGGGSSIYGGNAIAGTVNLKLKTPKRNSFNAEVNTNLIGLGVSGSGGASTDKIAKVDASLVTADRHAGISVYGYNRNREMFDADGDKFSEIAELKNTTFGTRLFHNFDSRDKLSLDFFVINEDRRGGNKFELIEHEADIAESVKHLITTGALTYTRFFRGMDLLTVYASTQNVDRDSYYGSNRSLKDYGATTNLSVSTGANYAAKFYKLDMIGGIEYNLETLEDDKLGYFDYEEYEKDLKAGKNVTQSDAKYHKETLVIANQKKQTFGTFLQADYKLFDNFKLSAGARVDRYQIDDRELDRVVNENTVVSPRVNFLYDVTDIFQIRGSFSTGYRAPQVFDEDLHIAPAGAKRIIHKNSDDLEQENSKSYMLSFNTRKAFDYVSFEFLTEGFYTKIDNPFANDPGELNAQNEIVYVRQNAEDGAKVAGLNFEFRLNTEMVKLNMGFTTQISEFEKSREIFSAYIDEITKENKPALFENDFLRTPKNYGFFTLDMDFTEDWCINIDGTYTGSMLVQSETRKTITDTDSFFNLGAKVTYTYKINGTSIDTYLGMKNIFNSYQNDFETGVNRDPAYIYGPMLPRTVSVGLSLSL